MKDSRILVTHYSKLKKKNEELALQLSEKDRIIEIQSNKISELSEEKKQLSAMLKVKSDRCQLSYGHLSKTDSSKPSDEIVALK